MADLNYYFGPWQRSADNAAWVPPAGTVGLLDFGSLNNCALSPSAMDMRGIGLFCTPRAVTLPSEYDLLDSGDCREIQVATKHRDLVEAVLGVRIDAGGTLAEACAALFGAGDPTGQERWKPLTPDRSGNYEIRLGGHSKIWGRKFLGLADPTWNRLRDLLRHDLDKHDKECKIEAKALKDAANELRRQGNGNGKRQQADALDARAAKIEFHAEKALDAMCRKYKCDPKELSTDIRRGKAETTISDDFSGTLSAWTQVLRTWSISSGKLVNDSTGAVASIRHNTALSSADHSSQAKIEFGTANYPGVAARFSSSEATYYWWIVESTSNCIHQKVVGGTNTTLGNRSVTSATGNTFALEVDGSTLTGYANGSGTSGLTDSAISGNLRVGISGYYYVTTWDDFYATDGIADGPAGKPYYAYAQQQ